MHIVIIDDEKILSKAVETKLYKCGYQVTTLMSFKDFLWFDTTQDVDLYLIDISLWDGSGIDIVKQLKKTKHTLSIPVIFISWHGDVDVKVEALDAWADDYIVKPFEFDELLARIRSNIRKTQPATHSSKLRYKNITFDSASRKVFTSGNEINLSKKEKQILEYFILNQNKCIPKALLQKMFWKDSSEFSILENTINVTICNLRKKLWETFILKTVVGEWYCLNK